MLLKFLVVIWFLKMVIDPFSKNFIYRTILKQCGENFNKINITSDTDTKTLSEEDKLCFGGSVLTLLAIFLWKIIVYIIDFIMMLSLLKYDNTYITAIFIGLSVLDLVIGLIKAKVNLMLGKNKKDTKLGDSLLETVREVEKTTFVKFILRIINILYWGYALYLLFFIK